MKVSVVIGLAPFGLLEKSTMGRGALRLPGWRSGEPVASVVNAPARLISPLATLNALRHWREATGAILQAAGKRASGRMVAGGAAPTDKDRAMVGTLADMAGGRKGHGLKAVRAPIGPLDVSVQHGGASPG